MNDYFFSARPGFPWSIYPLGLPGLAGVAALLVLFTVWTYLGHPQATRRRVLVVLLLRLAALLVALLTAVRPSVGVNENPKQPSVLLIGVDVSESMTVKDAIGGQARIDAVRKTLEKCQPLFDDLAAERGIDVVFYKFGPPDFNEATSRWDPAAPADAKRSDYGAYLFRTFERWQTEPRVRGTIVIGDGADNGETYAPFTEAGRWGRRGVPVHTVIVGEEGADTTSKDIAVTTVECDPSPAYIKNKVTVTARVNAYNFGGARVTARVSVNDTSVAQEDFTLDREKNNELKVAITAPEKPGEYKVRVEVGLEKDGKIEPLPGELSPLNNWSETYLTVLKQGVRVLIVDQLRWEETLLRDALRRDEKFNVSEVIRQTNLEPTAAERELLKLEDQAYDVVVIGNVSAEHLKKAAPEFLPRLEDLVKKKGIGVMFLGGEYALRDIPEALLPITGGAVIDDLDKAGNPIKTYPAIPTTRGLEKMFRVSGKPGEAPKPGESEELWDRMNNFRTGMRLNGYNRLTLPKGGVYTVYAWTTDSADPQVIKAGGDPKGDPLLVGSQRGDANKGRWLAFGAFDTYLWRGLGQPKTRVGIEMHERFWRQCVLWLAHQDEAEGAIEVIPKFRQLKVTQEQTVRIRAKLPSGEEDPTAALTVRILPLAPGAQEPKPQDEAKAPAQTVLSDAESLRYGRKVLFRPPVPGEYFVAVTAPVKDAAGAVVLNPDGSVKMHRGTAKFIAVPDVSDEMLQLRASPDFMQKLAVPTGGKALRLDDLPGFLAELKAEPEPDAGKKPRYYPDWHRNRSRGFLPLWLVIFAALLGGEWALRRLWGMV
jgi:hypothetical protein